MYVDNLYMLHLKSNLSHSSFTIGIKIWSLPQALTPKEEVYVCLYKPKQG